jgi:hypothetical protein
MGSCNIAQTGLALLGSSDVPASDSQVAGTIGTYHCTQLLNPTFYTTISKLWEGLTNQSNI